MDGIETLQALKEKEPVKYFSIPIVSLTANAIHGERERMLQVGFADYLTKPVNIAAMNEVLIKFLPKSEVEPVSAEDADKEQFEDPYDGVPKELFECTWIDPEEGLEYCGSVEMYNDAVSFFADATEKNAQLLENCLAEGDIELYTTRFML